MCGEDGHGMFKGSSIDIGLTAECDEGFVEMVRVDYGTIFDFIEFPFVVALGRS